MNSHKSKTVVSLLAFFWVIITIIAYYLSHKPFGPEFALSAARIIWNLTVTLLLTSIAGGIGVRLLPEKELNSPSSLVFQAAFGFGIMGVAFLIVGSLIGLNWAVGWGFVVTLGFFLRGSIGKWMHGLSSLKDIWQESDLFGKVAGIFSLLIVVLSLLVSISPPLRFDSLVYHLAIPKNYIALGQISYLPENMYWGFPQLVHMIYTLAQILGVAYPAAIGWMMGVLTILGLVGYTSQRIGLLYGWVAVAAMLSGFSLASSMAWGYVNWPSMLMAWGFIVSIDLWKLKGEKRDLTLAGVFAAFTFGMKYTAGIIFLTGLVIIIWRERSSVKQFGRSLLAYSFPSGLFAFPWLLKNYIGTGNPVYPLIFPAGAISEIRLAMFAGQPIQGNWLDAVFLPVRATYWAIENGHIGDAPGYEASIGAVLFGLGSLFWLGWKSLSKGHQEFVSTAGFIGVVGLLTWAVAGRLSGHLIRTHLYYSIFPAFALMAAAGFLGLDRHNLPGIRVGRIAAGLLILVFGINVIQVGINTFKLGAPQLLMGLSSEEDYITSNLGFHYPAMKVVNNLPEGSRTLMLWEARSYYCYPTCRPDEALDRWRDELQKSNDPHELVNQWVSEGFTHLLYFQLAADFIRENDLRYPPEEWALLENTLSKLTIVEDIGGAYILYSLIP